jgi:probable HAF family extracellular repeat protein
MINLGTLGGSRSAAYGINAAGQIVGDAEIPNGNTTHAFLYSGGTMTDLNALVPAGVTITSAKAINSAGQIAAVGTIGGGSSHALLLTPTLLNRFAYAYAWADSPTLASYTPDSHYAYDASGGAISITRPSVGIYDVTFDSLPGWGNNGMSSAVAVTAYGSSTVACSVVTYSSSPSSAVATVGWFDIVTKLSADSRFTVMILGNQGVPTPSAFVVSGGSAPVPPPNPAWSWTSGQNPITITHNSAPGSYNVLLGTGNTPKSAKLVTGSGGATRCKDAQGISGGLQVRCYDWDGNASDQGFWVMQVGGGRPGRRIGFAVANLPTSASYTPSASTAFNSSGGAITATRSGAGRYAMNFGGLKKLPGHTEHVQVTSVGTTLSACNVVNWSNSSAGLKVLVECRNGAGQFVDSRYNVLVIE